MSVVAGNVCNISISFCSFSLSIAANEGFFQMTSARDFFFLIIFISFVISARLIYSTEFWGSVLFLLHPSSHTYVYYARRSYYYVRGRGEESSDGRLTRILDMRLRLLDLDPPSNRFLIRWPVSRPPSSLSLISFVTIIKCRK